MHVDMPAADIDQLTWLDVGQHPLVLRRGGRRIGLSKNDLTNGKERDGRQSGAKCESGHSCSLLSQVALSLSSNAKDFRQAQMGSAIGTNWELLGPPDGGP
jgi:hypothetical protein